MRSYYLIPILVSSLFAEDFLANQSGTALTPGTWTQVTTANGYYDPLNPLVPGFSQNHWVPGLNCAMKWANYRTSSGETQKTLTCYDPDQNYMYILDDSGAFMSEHFNTPGHPNGGGAVDPVFNLLMSWTNNSGGRVTTFRQQTYWYDFWGLAGREKQGEVPGSAGSNALPAAAFDPVRRRVVYEGGLSFKGFSEYNPAAAAYTKGILCTSVSANCPNPSSQYSQLAYRQQDGCIWYWGVDGLFKYCNTGTPTSEAVAVSTCTDENGDPLTCPSPRNGSGWAHMPDEDLFLMAGGATAGPVGLTDTWILDPTVPSWQRVASSGYPYAGVIGGNFGRMVYAGNGLFVAWSTDNATQTGNPVWLFRLRAGSKYGWLTPSYPTATTGFNRSAVANPSWANRPAIAVSGTDLYLARIESGATNITTTGGRHFMPYVNRIDTTTGNNVDLGSTYNSVDNLNSGNGAEGDWPSLAIISGVPWVAWSSGQISTDQFAWKFNLASWNDLTWNLAGRMSTLISTGGQGMSKLLAIGTTPYWIMTVGANTGVNNVVVVRWTGSAFEQVGTTALQTGGNNSSFAGSVDLVSNGPNPIACWDQYVTGDTSSNVPQVYCSQWSGSAWQGMCGGASANTSSTLRAQHVRATYLGGVLYIAFLQRAAEGSTTWGRSELRVRSCSGTGGTWTSLGPTYLNRDATNGWAFKPAITNDGTDLYITWAEQGNTAYWLAGAVGDIKRTNWFLGLAQNPQIYADKLTTGGTRTALGGSLNTSTAEGSAQYPTIDVLSGLPVVAWREHKLGQLAQIYIKKWSGTDWVSVSTSVPASPVSATATRVGSSTHTGSHSVQ